MKVKSHHVFEASHNKSHLLLSGIWMLAESPGENCIGGWALCIPMQGHGGFTSGVKPDLWLCRQKPKLEKKIIYMVA